jgi:hypothetical protein
MGEFALPVFAVAERVYGVVDDARLAVESHATGRPHP